MKQAIIIASTASMILQFNMNNIKLLQDAGYEVKVACNFKDGNSIDFDAIENFKKSLAVLNIPSLNVPIPRNPLAIKSIILSYKMLKEISIKNSFDIMHCHSPIGAAIARLAFRKSRNKGTKVIYTAHGFHFYNGCPLKNWLLYYPIEYFLSAYTDILITINQEDYRRAQNFNSKRVEYVPGVGINLDKTNEINKEYKRQELGIPLNAFLMLSVGELNDNKNHSTIIKAMSKINNDTLYYVICGKGKNFKNLANLAQKLNLSKRVFLLGYRSDVNEIYQCADVYVFPSYREGLSVSLMEAMSYGLPCVVSSIRGNIDLIDDFHGGYIVSPQNINGFKTAIEKIIRHDAQDFGNYNRIKIESYSIESVTRTMEKIYFERSRKLNSE